ncbi:MAG: thiamine phosphate synthase [Ruminococcus sp.]|nr:thiamine phosphate synthase [Ruminococcus sp.]
MTLLEQLEDALKGGVTMVQLREKHLDHESFLEEAKAVQALCKRYNVPLLINDNVGIAINCGADGVHVGQDDMSPSMVRQLVGDKMIIGVTAKTVEQALAAQNDGADYLGCGALFATSTKSNAKPMSQETFSEICSAVDIPVVAIGGINRQNILELEGLGASGAAMVSAIFAADDIQQECIALKKLASRIIEVPERSRV